MSLKYRRSILFDHPEQTTAKLAVQTIVHDLKQRLKITSRSNSAIRRPSPQRMTIGQARVIESLQTKLKTISFHTLYTQYHRNTAREEESNINPERVEMFRSGKFYRCSQRPRKEEVDVKCEIIRNCMRDYYDRRPQQELSSAREQGKQKKGSGRAKTFHSSKKI